MSGRIGKWLIVEERPSASGKTRIFLLYPASRELESALAMPLPAVVNAPLGAISWYGPWRKYSLYPNPNTIFEADCLRAIADFCEAKTKAHREARVAARRPA